MLNKKEFVKLLIGGAIVFFAVFGTFFAYFYYQGMKEPIVPKETIEVSSMVEDMTEVEIVEDQDKVLHTTKVWIQVVDDQYSPIVKKEMSTLALVGLTRDELMRRFEGYKLIQFDESEVVLQKQLMAQATPKTYSLVIQEGMLGILEKGEASQFISLGLSEDAFSVADLVLLEGKGLDITLKQKIQLQQQPYYIEQILQNYSE